MSASQKQSGLVRQSSKVRRDSGGESFATVEQQESSSRRSPKKGNSRSKREQKQLDEDDFSDEDLDELENSFINDEEEEHEQEEDEMNERHGRRHKKKKLVPNYKIDEEDRDLILVNTGIEVKNQKRLKRNAEKDATSHQQVTVKSVVLAKGQQQSTAQQQYAQQQQVAEAAPRDRQQQIETMSKRRQAENRADLRRENNEYHYYIDRQQIAQEKLKQAQDIFGDDDEELELPMASNAGAGENYDDQDFMNVLEEAAVFDADEIDDPFSTALDKQILDTDICERLQVRIKKNRMRPQPEEIAVEAEWIFERLMNHTSLRVDGENGQRVETEHRYFNRFSSNPDATKEKIRKVLDLLRGKLYDVPMIVHYRSYEYGNELDEDSIWIIYNLDQEYGKFTQQKQQIQDFLQKITQICPLMGVYSNELQQAKLKSHLLNFNSLISYLTSYYKDQLGDGKSNQAGMAGSGVTGRKKEPLKRDEIQIAKQGRIDQFAMTFSLSWNQFLENLKAKQMVHLPPQPAESPYVEAKNYLNDQYPTEEVVRYGVCNFAAIELSAQPYIRNEIKNFVSEHAHITTELTEQGKKDLDLFHPSYRVKCVRRLPLSSLRNQNDLYLDVIECEKAGLITVNITVDQEKLNSLKQELIPLYMSNSQSEEDLWNRMRKNIITTLIEKLLLKELIKELREEIKEEAEAFVISKCKEVYRKLLLMGPFTTRDLDYYDHHRDQQVSEENKRPGREDNQVVKDRERNCVMGAIMHMIDNNNYVVTVAIVDKYGELIQTRDFMRLLPPRKRAPPKDQDGQPIMIPQEQKLAQPKTEDELQHEKDKKKLIELLEECKVDIITVAANCLEARYLKRQLESITQEFRKKSASGKGDNPEDHHRDRDHHSRGRSSGHNRADTQVRKEVLTIWGRTEVPKLFSVSHNSQKMHKNIQQMYKQAISLARFEQDPLCELINLWSPITAENQALALNMDPMQKCVNQSKLADGLEEVNIQVVNEVGIDINLAVEHTHMQSMLQFISGFGPRKANKFIAKIKKLDLKLTARSELLRNELLGQELFVNAHAFMKIRVPEEDLGNTKAVEFDILDQTRIHMESRKLAIKVATDAVMAESENAGRAQDGKAHQKILRDVMANPSKLKSVNLQSYFDELAHNNAGIMGKKINKIIDELSMPFGDPRKYRSIDRQGMSRERLFYLLIEESKRTFKKGLIVTATVTKVLNSKAICRLDNGLNAIILSSDFFEENYNQKEWIKTMNQGKIIQGRIHRIVLDEENKFEVQLNCKKRVLSSHEEYKIDLAESLGILPDQILPGDIKNHHFSADQRPKQSGRFIPRCIAHEKFKNISSRRAISELMQLENGEGEFFFRPSTRSEDRITLTWKFWKNSHFVHIDIMERDKQKGAAIGNTLIIGNDYYFESLSEIVERYIIPCNRLVREVIGHPKFSDAKTFEYLESKLKEEKKEDPARIPYRFAILPAYPQYIVLGYVPKERVVKEFIKVRPKGFYFHEENHAPFQKLINWFKENWRKEKYQHHLRRQRSPSMKVKAAAAPVEASSSKAVPNSYQQRNWGDAPSSHGQNPAGADSYIRQEQRAVRSPSYGGRPSQPRGGQSPGAIGGYTAGQANWGDPSKQGNAASSTGNPGNAGGNESPRRGGFGTLDDNGRSRGGERDAGGSRGGRISGLVPQDGKCFSCGEPGHKSFECPTKDNNRPPRRPMECYKCHKEGHMARNCPTGDGDRDRDRGDRGDRNDRNDRDRDRGDRDRGDRGDRYRNDRGDRDRSSPGQSGSAAYKRPRHDDDDGGYSRSNNAPATNMASNSLPSADAWGAAPSSNQGSQPVQQRPQPPANNQVEDWNKGGQGTSGWQ